MRIKALVLFFILLSATPVYAQEFKEEYYKAEVVSIPEEKVVEVNGVKNPYQKVELKLENETVTVDHGGNFLIKDDQKVVVGDIVVVTKFLAEGVEPRLVITDKYRLDHIYVVVTLFFVVVFGVVGRKSLGSLVGLVISFLVIIKFVVPQILAGWDPLFVSIIGSLFILVVTLYAAHGLSSQTSVALAATFASLLLTGLISYFFVEFIYLTGIGSEDAYALQLGPTSTVNLKGLLLGGIIIGTLGILDDVTTSQAAVVYELKKADQRLKMSQLFHRGLIVGKEHILSLVNTLILIYAGVTLPLFLLFVSNPRNTPAWVIFNSELIAEEVARSLAGSLGLIMAVPLATIIAAWYITRE